MAEMIAIHFKKGEAKTQYALMIRKGNQWEVFMGVWADHDDTAREKAADIVKDIEVLSPQYKNSVFCLMKMLSTNGTEDL